jgi:uncharacterized damage-inducible protein DinB
MELLDYLRRQFAYDAWANREVLTALGAGGGAEGRISQGRPLQLLAHVLSAERLWLERIKSLPQSSPVWPDFTVERCKSETGTVAAMWREYLAQISGAQLAETVRYKNSKGEEFVSSLQDIMNHVLLHSAYHRGQIATQMRTAGKEPAYTDFIHATRLGLIE